MKKKSRILALFTLVSVLLFTFAGGASAKEEQIHTVKLNDISVELPYDPNLYDFVRNETSTEVTVTVIERSSGKVETTIGELKDNNYFTREIAPAATDIKTIYQDYNDGFAIARLYAVLSVYSSGSFGQINSVLDTYWANVGDGVYTIEDAHANSVSGTGKFPTNKISVSGTAVIDVAFDQTGGFDLAGIGYSLTTSNHFRKAIQKGYTYTYGN
ncbi:hypothetical protein D3C76_950570 [compost metagenome]